MTPRDRRRWITLAEFIAIAGLMIGAATLYLNWSGRRDDQVARETAATAQDRTHRLVTLDAKVVDSGAALTIDDPAHDLSGATVRFASALGVDQQDAMPGPRIAADWIAAPVLRLTDGGPDTQSGRVPALITVTWWDGDTQRRVTDLYDLLWRTEGRMLRGRQLRLTGMVLAKRSADQDALAKAWRANPLSRKPAS